jgi:hypothetical protein
MKAGGGRVNPSQQSSQRKREAVRKPQRGGIKFSREIERKKISLLFSDPVDELEPPSPGGDVLLGAVYVGEDGGDEVGVEGELPNKGRERGRGDDLLQTRETRAEGVTESKGKGQSVSQSVSKLEAYALTKAQK